MNFSSGEKTLIRSSSKLRKVPALKTAEHVSDLGEKNDETF